MRNAKLEEAQAGIKTAGRNINNLRYTDDTTLTAESEEELKSLLIKVKEKSGKADLKLNIQRTKITASGPITSWQMGGETNYIFGLQNHPLIWEKICIYLLCNNRLVANRKRSMSRLYTVTLLI